MPKITSTRGVGRTPRSSPDVPYGNRLTVAITGQPVDDFVRTVLVRRGDLADCCCWQEIAFSSPWLPSRREPGVGGGSGGRKRKFSANDVKESPESGR